MKSKALVSVIIPTYNRARLVVEAINSVLRQTYGSLEVLVVDDHSTDNTEKAVKAYNDPRVEYIINRRIKGAQGARNTGILEANGDYICFLDSDDLLQDDKLELQVKHLESNPILDFSVGSTLKGTTFADARITDPLNLYNITVSNFLRGKIKFLTGAPLWRKEAVVENGYWLEVLENAQDWEYHLRALLKKLNCEYCPEAKFLLREHKGSRIGNKNVIQNVEHKLLAIQNIKQNFQLEFPNNALLKYIEIKHKYVRWKKSLVAEGGF